MKFLLPGIFIFFSQPIFGQPTIPLDIDVLDAKGNTINTSEIVLESEFIIVDFWNSGCKPCIIQLNSMALRYEELKGRGIHVIAVSTFPPSTASEKIIEKYQWPFDVYYDTTKKFFRKYSRLSVTLPLTLIFDQNWNLVYKAKGAPVRIIGEDGELFLDVELVMEYVKNGSYEKLDLDMNQYYDAIENYKINKANK